MIRMMVMAEMAMMKARTEWSRIKARKGQNTVEYLLMLTVVVGVVMLAGAAIKRFMPDLFAQIQTKISSAAGTLSSTGGNSN